MMARSAPMIIITTISGTAITPFSTAAQKSALMGEMGAKVRAMPTRVAAASAP